MTLLPGTRLGSYEILAPLGAGGMGEVYRARDTQLDRNVAIKVLPEVLAGNPDRLARFDREAKVLAALNHPNIAQIYGIEQGALVMELVEGTTLPAPLPLATALEYARQIAAALDAAHEKGIVHRDLKPANIKVTPQGVIKVLDFGLAKAIEPSAASVDPTISPTLTLGATQLGTILGTAAYMSPEQARGQPVDKRADIWAFGVVLYEMLTGRRLFEGDTVSDTLAAVLKFEPALDRLPPEIRSAIGRCLRKDPRQRWRDIGDVQLALSEQLVERPATAPSTATARAVVPWAAAAVLAIALAGSGWITWRATRPASHPLMRLNVALGPDAVAGNRTTAAISPDGARLVFPIRRPDGGQQLATRLLDQPLATPLAGTENGSDAFFSPDGQWIGFFADGKLKKVAVQGGAVVTLCDAPNGRGAWWGEDGTIIAALDSIAGIGLTRVPDEGGTPQKVTQLAADASHRWPQILPGGAVLFTASRAIGDYENATIDVFSPETGRTQVLIRGGYFGRYLPSGHLVYVHQGTLFGVALNLDRLQVLGSPVPLLQDVAGNSISAGGQFDFARNGTFVYVSGKSAGQQIMWLDSAGKTEPLLPAQGAYFDLRFSPDGKRLALAEAATNILAYDWERDIMARLTFTEGNRYPVWTPDSKHIAFTSQSSLRWVRADGGGEVVTLLDTKFQITPHSFSPDGKLLAYSETNPASGFDLWTLPLDTSDPDHPKPGQPELFFRTPFNEIEPAFSPDGRWIAYTSNESGRNEVYVRPFPRGTGKWLISAAGGRFPIWARQGRNLFYETLDNHITVVAYTAQGDSFSPERPRRWTDTTLLDVPPAWNLDLAPDGKRFAVLLRPDLAKQEQGSLQITFLLNFFDEVQRRIPAPH